MNSRILLLIAVLAAPAHAQLVYECLGDDGKTFFSESTCKGKGLYSLGRRGYASSFPERREILQRWGITEVQLKAVEMGCDEGNRVSCETLETYKTRTLAQVARELTQDAHKACRGGHKASCEALATNKREIQRAMGACDAGVKAECEKLTRLAQ